MRQLQRNYRRLSSLCVLGLAACVQVQPAPDFKRARDLVEASTGQGTVFDPYAAALTPEAIEQVFANGLTLDEALRLALVNNRELQAEFQEIGIAHADWVQARLWQNPSLEALILFPAGGGRSLLEATVSLELLDLWRIPARTRVAKQDLEATLLRVARRAGEHLAQARQAYYGAVAAAELEQVAEDNVQLMAQSYGAVQSLQAAGAADAFDENLARGPLLGAQLVLQTARIESANALRALAKELSVTRTADAMQLSDGLPLELPADLDQGALVQQALAARLDLRALQAAINAQQATVELEKSRAWGELGVGASVERPAGSGSQLTGPSLSASLPIFDQNQAQVARAEFELQQLIKLQQFAQVSVTQDVRSSVERVRAAAHSLSFYAEQVLPQAERSLALLQQSFEAGQSPLLALIEVQRQMLEARRAHISLRLEAASAAAELARVLGAPLQP